MFVQTFVLVCGLLWSLPSPATALTAQEILLLKQNGVTEKTIQMMIESEMRANASRDAASREPAGVHTITRPDGRPAIVYRTGSVDAEARDAEERLKEARAWEMLRHLIIDTRSADD
jgi:hypothetical protein